MKKTLLLVLLFITTCTYAQDFKSWAKTPPMGWNSWICYGPTVVESEVKANADFMAKKLKDYGWEYVVVDIRWFVANDHAGGYNEKDPVYAMDSYGRYLPAENRFPSAAEGKGFKALADYVHSKGLKFGIHIMRGIPKIAVIRHTPILGTNGITADMIANEKDLCKWLHDNLTIDASKPGAQEYYNSIINMYADWGVDFLKVDDLSAPVYHADEVELIRKAIDQCGKKMVLSTSPGVTPIEYAEHVQSHANMWREVGDVWDNWGAINNITNVSHKWLPYIAEGTWPDCDLIPLGHLCIRGERGKERMSALTKDEQFTLMTLYTITKSPLMFSGDLPTIDPFTMSLLTNKEVLRMHSESSDIKAVAFVPGEKNVIISRNPKTGEVYLAVFNLTDKDSCITIDKTELESSLPMLKKGWFGHMKNATDLWSGEKASKSLTFSLKPHASKLIKYN